MEMGISMPEKTDRIKFECEYEWLNTKANKER